MKKILSFGCSLFLVLSGFAVGNTWNSEYGICAELACFLAGTAVLSYAIFCYCEELKLQNEQLPQICGEMSDTQKEIAETQKGMFETQKGMLEAQNNMLETQKNLLETLKDMAEAREISKIIESQQKIMEELKAIDNDGEKVSNQAAEILHNQREVIDRMDNSASRINDVVDVTAENLKEYLAKMQMQFDKLCYELKEDNRETSEKTKRNLDDMVNEMRDIIDECADSYSEFEDLTNKIIEQFTAMSKSDLEVIKELMG